MTLGQQRHQMDGPRGAAHLVVRAIFSGIHELLARGVVSGAFYQLNGVGSLIRTRGDRFARKLTSSSMSSTSLRISISLPAMLSRTMGPVAVPLDQPLFDANRRERQTHRISCRCCRSTPMTFPWELGKRSRNRGVPKDQVRGPYVFGG